MTTGVYDENGKEVMVFEPIGGLPTYSLEKIVLEHRRAVNVGGGSTTANAWNALPMTDLVYDSSGLASIAGNIITLPGGAYHVRAYHVLSAASTFRPRIRVVGGSEIVSVNVRGLANEAVMCIAEGFIYTDISRQIWWEYYVDVALATTGLGVFMNASYIETYGRMVLERLTT